MAGISSGLQLFGQEAMSQAMVDEGQHLVSAGNLILEDPFIAGRVCVWDPFRKS